MSLVGSYSAPCEWQGGRFMELNRVDQVLQHWSWAEAEEAMSLGFDTGGLTGPLASAVMDEPSDSKPAGSF